ncbi:MAG: GIY-YIG nuclease family protein [Patescibacteria group bacterium]|nr:GIY-YIG nuclease family protein [Patescibacteria group bacterium]
MYSDYVLKSIKRSYLYVGMTNNINRRFFQHQYGREKTTAPYRPFKLLIVEKYDTRKSARVREKYLKSGVGKEWIKRYDFEHNAQVAKLADALP